MVVFLWWRSGVFGVAWWCFCGGVCVVVFWWWWWRGGVFVFFFGQGSTFVALPRSYAKSVDNTGVKRCLV